MKKTYKLPDRAKLIEPITRVIGRWVEMTFDAKTERCGVTWFRVKDGMGGRGDGEDWVADVPNVPICVHDYHWNGDSFGANHGTFDNACQQELIAGLQQARRELRDTLESVERIKTAVYALEKVLGHIAQPTERN